MSKGKGAGGESPSPLFLFSPRPRFVPAVPGRSIFEKARKKTAAPLHLSINLTMPQKNCEKHRGAAAQIVEIETPTLTREAHMSTCSACNATATATQDPCDQCAREIADGWNEFDRQRLNLNKQRRVLTATIVAAEDVAQRTQRN